MVSREELDAKRALARQRHRAATRKVSRLKNVAGVEISGTRLDPRRDLGSLKKLNSKQLDSYINRLDSFVSRETSYVAGAKGEPVSGNLWKTINTLKNTVNKNRAEDFNKVKDIFIPTLGMTAGQFQGMKPTHPVTGNPASRAPNIPIVLNPAGIPNDKAAKKVIKDLQAKLNPEYTDKIIRRDRKIVRKMIDPIVKISGAGDIKDSVKGLTKGQFSFLWNNTNFADIASFEYQIARSKVHDPASMAQFDAAFETQIREMRRLLKDVKQLDL